MSSPHDSSPPASPLKVAGVVGFYMVAAMVMVFVNKAVLLSTPDLPFLFLFIQLSIAVVLLQVVSWISYTPIGRSFRGQVDIPTLSWDVAKKLTPLISAGSIALIFNTLCLKGVDASFFQIARGLLLPMTIAVSVITTRQLPSSAALGAAALVTIGFFAGMSPSALLNSASLAPVTALPIIFGVLSSVMTAAHAVFVKDAHAIMGDHSVVKLTYWGNLLCAVPLIPMILFNGELGIVLSGDGRDWSVFVSGCLVTGVCGFFLGMAGLLSIKVTSPITHMFSSAARSVIQTVLGALLFGEIITPSRAGSIFLITLGTVYYTWVQSRKSSYTPLKQQSDQESIDLEKQEHKA